MKLEVSTHSLNCSNTAALFTFDPHSTESTVVTDTSFIAKPKLHAQKHQTSGVKIKSVNSGLTWNRNYFVEFLGWFQCKWSNLNNLWLNRHEVTLLITTLVTSLSRHSPQKWQTQWKGSQMFGRLMGNILQIILCAGEGNIQLCVISFDPMWTQKEIYLNQMATDNNLLK